MRVRPLHRVRSDLSHLFPEEVRVGYPDRVYEAGLNRHGAVWLVLEDGRHLGVLPDEYEVIEAAPDELARLPEVVRLRHRVAELEGRR